MYWLPWLAAVRSTLKIAPERIIPITRGGAAAWYQAPKALELFAMRTPQDVRIENRRQAIQYAMLKQTTVTAWDRAVLRDAAETMGYARYLTLHPAWMYQACTPFWEGQRGLEWLLGRCQFQQPMPAPDLPPGVTLSPNVVAMGFYQRATFPPNEMTAAVARTTMEQLAKLHDVVLLSSGSHLDDHVSYAPKKRPSNVVTLKELYPMLNPHDNLAVQSAVIAKAIGFVGTYGGLSQLALRHGKPSVSYFLDWGGTAYPHKHLADFLSLATGTPYLVHRVIDIPLAREVLPAIQFTRPAENKYESSRQPQPVSVVSP